MKSEPTVIRTREWVGVAANGEEILADGNPNPSFPVPMHLTTLDHILSFGQMFRVANCRTMRYYCKMWNEAVRKMRFDGYERLLVRPARAEFTLTIQPDGRRRK